VTAEEAGWPPSAIEDALHRLSDAELTLLASERLAALGHSLKRQEHDERASRRAWDHLA
jgi:metal-dependent HD superfamily phosphatase/phosphodiesterase